MTATDLLVVAFAMVVILTAGRRLLRRFSRVDSQWLPHDLGDSTLLWSERTFRCNEPVPLVVRIDRAYRERTGVLTLVEFKRRAVLRVYPADIVELSVQRHVLQRAGQAVSRRAYVVVVPAGDGPCRPLPVELEDAPEVQRRVARLVDLLQGRSIPHGARHSVMCHGCGHWLVCPRKAR